MSENTQNNTPKKEQYSLNDDRRVKVLSPGALVAKRFFRNRLAVVGLTMLLAMFVFSFIGGVVSPYGQDQQFYTYTQMSKEYVGVTRNDTMRFVVADGQDFASDLPNVEIHHPLRVVEDTESGTLAYQPFDVLYGIFIRYAHQNEHAGAYPRNEFIPDGD